MPYIFYNAFLSLLNCLCDRFYVWEIMHATIKKMSKQVDKLQQDVEDAKDKLDAAKRKVQ